MIPRAFLSRSRSSRNHDCAGDRLTTTIQRLCPLCGAAGGAEVLRHDSWRLVQCPTCDLAYLPEIPTDAAIDVDFEWSESFARERRERWLRNPLMRLFTAAMLLVKPPREYRAMRRIRRVAPPGRMLDVGCGDGRLAGMAQRFGYDSVGVELSPQMAAKARSRLGAERVLVGRLQDFPLAAGTFDLIVTVSYMEHEPNPALIARRMFELTRPGGVCGHKVPNYDSRLRTWLGRRWSGYRWPEHVQYYTPKTLTRLMLDAGFEIIRIDANSFSDNFWLFARRPMSGAERG